MTATVLLIYSLISGAVLTLLWAAFRLARLNRLTCHKLNRALLVSILAASVALPFAAFFRSPEAVAVPVAIFDIPADIEFIDVADVAAAEPVAAETPSYGQLLLDRIVSLLPVIYIIGLSLSALWLLMALTGVALAIIKGEKRRIDRRTTIVVHSRKLTPFTWGRWIVVSRSDLDANAEMLLSHESAHKVAVHWLDLLIGRIIACVDWYWPSAWLINRDLAAVHEFQADRIVLDRGTAAATYQMLLIRKGAPGFFSNIVNPFNYNSLKNRITMMQKKQSSARSRMRYLVMLPAAALAIYLTSAPALASAVSSAMPAEPAIAEPPSVSETTVTANIAVPTDTAKVKYYPSVEVKEPVTGTIADMFVGINTTDRQPLYVVDGVISTPEAARNLPSEKVILVGVNHTQAVVDKYVEAAKDGVIEITTTDAPEEMQAAVKERIAQSEVLTADNAVKVNVRTRTVNGEAGNQDPSFPGGDEKMYQFIARNIRYPEDAVLNNIQGTVIVQFKVEKDGSITDARVVEKVYPSLDAEAIRVVNTLPKFNPAIYKGEPVGFWYTLPISFKFSPENTNMLYILDGRKLTAEEIANISKLVAGAELGDATVLTPERAKELYGEEGANGAVLLRTGSFRTKEEARNQGSPTFPGGDQELFKFLNMNIRYPAEAHQKNIQGRVIVQFKVQKDGSITDAHVVRGVDPLLDAEAVRVVNLLPKFNPAKQNGEPVVCVYSLPLTFKLSDSGSNASEKK